MMKSVRTQSVKSFIRTYFLRNKKVIICTLVAFVIAVMAGVFACIRSVDGEFERVARADMEFGAFKVFFVALFALAGGYIVILIAGTNNKTVILVFLPFIALGFVCGQYSCALVARYETLGLVNLFVVYLPFFIVCLVCFVICAVSALTAECGCNGQIRPSFIIALKVFCINVVIAFVLFAVIGSIFGVIVISVY